MVDYTITLKGVSHELELKRVVRMERREQCLCFVFTKGGQVHIHRDTIQNIVKHEEDLLEEKEQN